MNAKKYRICLIVTAVIVIAAGALIYFVSSREAEISGECVLVDAGGTCDYPAADVTCHDMPEDWWVKDHEDLMT